MSEPRKREPWNPLLKSYPESEKINAVSIGAETMYTRLIAKADDRGNYYGDSALILAYLFGHRFAAGTVSGTDTARWRDELETVGLVTRYEAGTQTYLHVVNPHRRLRKDVKPDEQFPREPDDANTVDKTLSEHGPNTARTRPEHGPLDQDQDKTKTRPRKDKKILPETKFAAKKNGEVDCLIDYLNEVSHSRFRHSNASRKPINARLTEGATEEDVRLVIDYKCACWLGDPEWEGYLNPETLCRPTKFERNLNAALKWDKDGRPPLNEKARREANDEAIRKWVEEEEDGEQESHSRIEQTA
jgi:uncharacterized phage protein (TIGR02220 family)